MEAPILDGTVNDFESCCGCYACDDCKRKAEEDRAFDSEWEIMRGIRETEGQ